MANYFIIGADRKEYGPVSTDEVRKWIAEGRADAQTQVRADGTTEWLPLSAVPELGDGLKKTAPPPPPIGALPTAGKTSALAVTSLVLAILALPTCGATALFGLICGIIAMVKVSNSRGALRGQGLALAGTIVSGVFLILLPVLAAMLLPALAAAKQKAQANQLHEQRKTTRAGGENLRGRQRQPFAACRHLVRRHQEGGWIRKGFQMPRRECGQPL